MGLILVFVILILIITGLTYLGCDDDPGGHAGAAFIITTIIAGGITVLCWLYSYDSLLDVVAYRAMIPKYEQALEEYKAASTAAKPDGRQALTDLEYQNYQSSIKEMIADLRRVRALEAKIMAKKKARKSTFMFNWIIFMPPDPLEGG